MMHPDLTRALAAEHRQDLLRHANEDRLARQARAIWPRRRRQWQWHVQSPIVRRPLPHTPAQQLSTY